MGWILPTTRVEERLGSPRKVTSLRSLDGLSPTPEQARQISRALKSGAEVRIQPVTRVTITYPSKLQRKLGATQLYLGKDTTNALRIL